MVLERKINIPYLFIQQTFIKYPLCAGTLLYTRNYCCLVAQLCLTLWPHGLQHARLPCLSPSPGACSNSCLLSWWCHPTISSSIVPFSSCLQSFPASGSFLMSQFLASDGQSIQASVVSVNISASVISVNIQDWFPLELTSLISLQPKGLSGVFSKTTVQKHQFFGVQLSLSPTLTSIHDYWKNHSFVWLDRPLLAKQCLCFWICWS